MWYLRGHMPRCCGYVLSKGVVRRNAEIGSRQVCWCVTKIGRKIPVICRCQSIYCSVYDQSSCIYIYGRYKSFYLCLNRVTFTQKHVSRYIHRHSLSIYTGLDQVTGLRIWGLLCQSIWASGRLEKMYGVFNFFLIIESYL